MQCLCNSLLLLLLLLLLLMMLLLLLLLLCLLLVPGSKAPKALRQHDLHALLLLLLLPDRLSLVEGTSHKKLHESEVAAKLERLQPRETRQRLVLHWMHTCQ